MATKGVLGNDPFQRGAAQRSSEPQSTEAPRARAGLQEGQERWRQGGGEEGRAHGRQAGGGEGRVPGRQEGGGEEGRASQGPEEGQGRGDQPGRGAPAPGARRSGDAAPPAAHARGGDSRVLRGPPVPIAEGAGGGPGAGHRHRRGSRRGRRRGRRRDRGGDDPRDAEQAVGLVGVPRARWMPGTGSWPPPSSPRPPRPPWRPSWRRPSKA